MTSWDNDLGDSGVGLDLPGVSPINSADTSRIDHVATCEIRGGKKHKLVNISI